MKLIALALAAVALAAALGGVEACGGTPKIVSASFASAKPVNKSYAYTQAGEQQYLDKVMPINNYVDNTKTTFRCVDSRGDEPQLGAFGGDFGEMAGAIAAYLQLTGMPKGVEAINAAVKNAFYAFMADNASPKRPFYFHTSADKMMDVFKQVAADGITPEPVIFPENMPANTTAQKIWIKALTKGKNQGCGHVRLMIDQPADYGLGGPEIPQALIKAFFEYWWPQQEDHARRDNVEFVFKQGSLGGRAITIVSSKGACKGQSPALPPADHGSQTFLFHPDAVGDFRKEVLAPWFVRYAEWRGKKIDQGKYLKALNDLQTKQLGATLKFLSPANSLPIYTVEVTTKDDDAPITRPAVSRKLIDRD
ncbi:hypothetical protein Rsub_12946 [Raphidocelis subcapitata]|uniref:Uncharacterized protein n=1 Tax=Raphidocelis subcapitata TaxID=307507 RepID=A0A2V0PJ58_9CHLO|nr:hypothetical protein Rsub_12946 [Raphidocelis subcapitata]|eukprot:GBF99831.1 hypothetical protein Rsub_12946 [Raphidocelis subcapitata]